MFEIYAKLVDWVADLLAWLSTQQLKAAKVRIKSCTKLIEENNKALLAYEARVEKTRIALENERERMQAFVDQESVEL